MATIEERIYEADQAKLVLENPVFQQALDDIKAELIESWKTAPARDAEGREKLWQLLKLAEKLEANLKQRLETGKLARLELNNKESMLEKAKRHLSGIA
jgi:hypothetical protein